MDGNISQFKNVDLKGLKAGKIGLNTLQTPLAYETHTKHLDYFRKHYNITFNSFDTLQRIYLANKPVSLDYIYKHQTSTYYSVIERVNTLINRGLIEKLNKRYTVSQLFLDEIEKLQREL
jgi:hypothetical protein